MQQMLYAPDSMAAYFARGPWRELLGHGTDIGPLACSRPFGGMTGGGSELRYIIVRNCIGDTYEAVACKACAKLLSRKYS